MFFIAARISIADMVNLIKRTASSNFFLFVYVRYKRRNLIKRTARYALGNKYAEANVSYGIS